MTSHDIRAFLNFVVAMSSKHDVGPFADVPKGLNQMDPRSLDGSIALILNLKARAMCTKDPFVEGVCFLRLQSFIHTHQKVRLKELGETSPSSPAKQEV